MKDIIGNAKAKKMNAVLLSLLLTIVLATPTLALMSSDNVYGSDGASTEITVSGNEDDPYFYIPPPPMPGEEDEESPQEELFLSVSQDIWNPGPEASSITIYVTSNDNWGGIFPDPSDWLTIPLEGVTTQIGNGSFEIRVTENTEPQPRTTRVSIGGQGGTEANRAIITITQQGAEADMPYLTLSKETWDLGTNEDRVTIYVTSNIAWDQVLTNAYWLTVTDISPAYGNGGTGNGSFVIRSDANTDNQPRSGWVSVSGSGITRTVYVTQQGVQGEDDFLIVSPDSWDFGAEADSATINVISNTNWRIQFIDSAWINVTDIVSDYDSGGSGNGSLRINVEPNTDSLRTGSIVIVGGDITRTITVTQQATQQVEAFLTVSPESWDVGYAADSTTINVTSNINWRIQFIDSAWINVTDIVSDYESGGSGNGSFRINVESNTDSLRTGSIIVTGGGITRTITVIQQAVQQEESILIVSPESWVFGAEADSTTVEVTSNISWVITSNASWLTIANVTPEYGNGGMGNGSFAIRATTNDSNEPRSGYVWVSGNGITRTITITQQGQELITPELTLSQDEWEIAPEAASTTVYVTANIPWNEPVTNVDWLTISSVNRNDNFSGSFRINADANTDIWRTGTITVTGGGITRTLTVIQHAARGPVLIVSPTSWNLAYTESATTIDVTSNISWLITTNASWLTISDLTPEYGNGGYGDGSFTIRASTNDSNEARNGYVWVSGDGITRTITVTQQAAQGEDSFLTITPETWELEADSDRTTISVTSNIPWLITTNASWLTISDLTPEYGNGGYGDGSFVIRATSNTGEQPRSGTVWVSGDGITRTVSVIQNGQEGETPYLSLSKRAWDISSDADSTPVYVNSNVQWVATTSNPEWLNVSPESGNGNGSLQISALANWEAESRTGYITVSGGGISLDIEVYQEGADVLYQQEPFLRLTPTRWQARPAGGLSPTITVESNVTWTITIPENDSNWLSYRYLSPGSNNENGSFRLYAYRNDTNRTRSTFFFVEGRADDGVSVVKRAIFAVSQEGGSQAPSQPEEVEVEPYLYLQLNGNLINQWMSSYYGQNATIDVITNTSWEISVGSNVSWLVIDNVTPANSDGNGSFRITARPNSTNQRRVEVTITVSGGGITRDLRVQQARSPALIEFDHWHCYSASVAFWPGEIRVYTTSLDSEEGLAPCPYFDRYHQSAVTGARNVWSEALGVQIGTSRTSAEAQIYIYGGLPHRLEARFGWHPGRLDGILGMASFGSIYHEAYISVNGNVKRVGRLTCVRVIHVQQTGRRNTSYFYNFLALHEVGHALGYRGHALNYTDIMASGVFGASHEQRVFSPEEIRHLRQIYDYFR